jgi:hypothetical protein
LLAALAGDIYHHAPRQNAVLLAKRAEMTESHQAPTALRDLGALIAALFFSAAVNLLLGRVGIAAAVASQSPMDTAAVFAVMIFFLVPMVAGVLLGAFAPHPVRLAIPLVTLSLVATYVSLGSAGMPHGWKIFEYVVQTAVIAGAAASVAAYRRRVSAATSAP